LPVRLLIKVAAVLGDLGGRPLVPVVRYVATHIDPSKQRHAATMILREGYAKSCAHAREIVTKVRYLTER
jgi:hypothetical protein